MRTAGGWIVALGVIGAIAALMMDVSVSTGMGGYVNNIGLMADRQNYVIVAGFAIVVGVILIVSDRRPAAPKPIKDRKEKLPYGIFKHEGLYNWGGQSFATADDAEAHVKKTLADHAASIAPKPTA